MRTRVGVRMMESIERPLWLHRDREHPVVHFPHLDPQLPRTLPPKQPHLCPAGRALGKHAWESRRHRSSLSADPSPFRACLESNGRGQHGEEPRARSVWMTPSWLGGSWPKSPPFRQDPDARQPLPHRQSVRKPVRLRRAMADRYGARPFSRPPACQGGIEMRGKSAVATARDPLPEVPSGARLLPQPRGRAGACRSPWAACGSDTGCSVSSCGLADKPPSGC